MNRMYTKPVCEAITVATEFQLLDTSRFSETGNSSSPNSDKEHYNDPTGHVDPIEGGESLAKPDWSFEE